MTEDRGNDVNPLVTYGLLVAWMLHDTEELITGPRWMRENVPQLRKRFPQVPERIWAAAESVDDREFRVAVSLVGTAVAAAAVAGHRTGGRSGFYQGVLDGFGLHGVMHMAQAAAVRGYTPGVVTSPLLVVPFTLWARGRLRRAGVLRPARVRDVLTGVGAVVGTVVVSHAVARKITAGWGR